MHSIMVFSASRTRILLFSSLVLILHGLAKAQPDEPLYHVCINSSGYYTVGSQFENNLNVLLIRSLYNDGGNSIYSNQTEGEYPDKVFGIFLCRGDVEPEDCQNCIDTARRAIVTACPLNKEAIIWYDQCLIRYSNRSFFSTMESSPSFYMWNVENVTQPDRFNEILRDMFNNLTTVATSIPSNQLYANGNITATNYKTLYGMVQCTPDLSPTDCRLCLSSAVDYLLARISAKAGGRLFQPSCNIRYELYPFSGDPRFEAQPPSANRTDHSDKETQGRSRKTTLIATITSASAILVVLLLGLCIRYQRIRKRTEEGEKRESQEIQLLELSGGRLDDDYSSDNLSRERQVKSQDFPLIRLDLIRAATELFSEENKLGQGGFGPVYKGTLLDGKEIAHKRLSRNSGQGLQEFKNEVTLIANYSIGIL